MPDNGAEVYEELCDPEAIGVYDEGEPTYAEAIGLDDYDVMGDR